MPLDVNLTNPLDETDRKIVSALSENGRRPYREIARSLGISEGAVRQRVTRLTEEGFIRVTAIGNLNALGFDVVAMVMIKVRPGTVDACADALAAYPSIRFVAILFGGADISIQTIHNTLEELHAFVRNTLPHEIPDIVSIDTFPEVRTVKSSWNWDDWFNLKKDPVK